MSIRVAINGFGRIGRNVARVIKKSDVHDLEIVAVNDLTDKDMLAHLFKYDSVHGIYDGQVSTNDKGLVIDGTSLKVFSERDPERLPWKELEVDIVVESTGFFRERQQAALKKLSTDIRPHGGAQLQICKFILVEDQLPTEVSLCVLVRETVVLATQAPLVLVLLSV